MLHVWDNQVPCRFDDSRHRVPRMENFIDSITVPVSWCDEGWTACVYGHKNRIGVMSCATRNRRVHYVAQVQEINRTVPLHRFGDLGLYIEWLTD